MNGVKHLISIKRLGADVLFEQIIPACLGMIEPASIAIPTVNSNHPKTVLYFDEDSTRTRMSFAEAARLLNWDAAQETLTCNSRNKHESWFDTLMMWHEFNTKVICARTHQEGVQLWLAEKTEQHKLNIGIINAGDGRNQHPTQTILDLVTIQKKLGRLDDFKIGFVGDLQKSRTTHSLLDALHMRNKISVVCVSPDNVKLPRHYAGMFSDFTEESRLESLSDCDVIYVVRWQAERLEPNSQEFRAFLQVKQHYQINKKALNMLKPNVMIMHALPIDQTVEEIAHDIMNDSRVVAYEQAWFGVPCRMAILQMILNNLQEYVSFNPAKNTIIQEEKNLSLTEALKKTRNKQHEHFIPLECGTVIDHLEPGAGIIIRMMLKRTASVDNDIIIVENKNPLKDMLALKGIFLTEKTMIDIAGLSPRATFNVMREGRFKKIRIIQPKQVISGIGTCLNTHCVTQSGEPGITSRFINTSQNSHPFECDYCGQHFTLAEILPIAV